MSDKILLVEDDSTLSLFYSRALRRAGYTVEIVSRGDVGFRRAVAEDFDLIILDWGLPGLDGLEVMTKLHSERPELRIMMLSGSGDDVRRAALEAGADRFLPKPCGLADLTEAVGEILGVSAPQVSLEIAGMS